MRVYYRRAVSVRSKFAIQQKDKMGDYEEPEITLLKCISDIRRAVEEQ